MNKRAVIFLAMVGWLWLTIQAPAQTANATVPATTLETWEAATDRVMVKGTAPVGSVSLNGAVMSVTCEELAVGGLNQKMYGIRVGIAVKGQSEGRTVLDYDELDSLLSAIDYLSKVDWSVTSLSSFDASYTSKAGLRVAAFSSKRAGMIEYSVRGSLMGKRVVVTQGQLSQLRSLVEQAKNNLDAIRHG